MTSSKGLVFYVLLTGIVQLVVGAVAFAWAWPLFGDPPFLHHGLVSEYAQVRAVLVDTPAMANPLSGLRSKLEWLYARQIEGVLIVLVTAVTLMMFGSVSVLLGFRSVARLRKSQ